MEHHKLGPSNYPAWSECVHYRSTERSSDEANEGTKAHKELEMALVNPDFIPSNKAAAWAAEWVRDNTKDCVVYSESTLSGVLDSLGGIFGTCDASWNGKDNTTHIADFKTFSDGTVDYSMQLRGYAALMLTDFRDEGRKVCLHILHGGVFKVETVETTMGECLHAVETLLRKVEAGEDEPRINKWCQYCSKIKECKMTNNALQVVHENGLTFSKMSICQKLVVLDAVDNLSKSIREEAKKMAEESEDKAIEMDGIRYELKPWAGPSKCRDIREVASEAANKSIEVDKKTRKGVESQWVNGITQDALLDSCTLSKSSLVKAMMDANAGSSLTKADWERWAEQFFEKTEGKPHFVRTM